MKLNPDRHSTSRARRDLLRAGACVAVLGPIAAQAQQVEVALAGLAFSGDAASMAQRFPYSVGYEKALKSGGKPAYMMMRDAIAQTPPQQLKLVAQIDELKGRDQAIAVALVIGSETVSVEQLAGLHKLFVLIRAQALFFDFKSMSVIRAYPISFAHIDIFDRPPSADEIRVRVRGVYEGVAGKPGIFARFGTTLAKATMPSATSRYLQISKIGIKPEAVANIPAYLTGSPTVAETWAADLVGEALSTRAGVPIIPYAKGYAVGNVMSMRISDGDVYNLKLPKPDYEISVELSALRKIEYGKAAAGASYIYGSYASVKIEEPVSGKVYMNTPLKNGEIKLVPVTQTYVDDFPAYYDSVNGLFVKLSEALAGKGNDWVKSAAAATDIDKQITDTRELIKLCK
ncbi:MAG: hypothetical protein ABI702_19525 [Burkholderiales bacterium]